MRKSDSKPKLNALKSLICKCGRADITVKEVDDAQALFECSLKWDNANAWYTNVSFSPRIWIFMSLLETLKSCNAQETTKIASEIIGSHDIAYIRELSEAYGKLIPIIVSLQHSKNSDDLNKKLVLSNLANFLSEVKLNGCRCGVYRTLGGSPAEEQSKGLVIICEDPRNNIETVVCKCRFCNKTFTVHTYESGISYKIEWRKSS